MVTPVDPVGVFVVWRRCLIVCVSIGPDSPRCSCLPLLASECSLGAPLALAVVQHLANNRIYNKNISQPLLSAGPSIPAPICSRNTASATRHCLLRFIFTYNIALFLPCLLPLKLLAFSSLLITRHYIEILLCECDTDTSKRRPKYLNRIINSRNSILRLF